MTLLQNHWKSDLTMKRILIPVVAAIFIAVSCGPSKHAVHVEMRHPSKAGLDLAGKNLSVVYFETEDDTATGFCESMADGFAYTLEQDYGLKDGAVGIYRMPLRKDTDYKAKDALSELLIDTGSDLVFLFDTVKFGNMTVGRPSRLAYSTVVDSSYVSSGSIPFTVKLYAFDGMDKNEKVHSFGGTSIARPEVYSNGKDDSTVALAKAMNALKQEGWEAGETVADSFKSQWKHEQYSIIYFDTKPWYDALEKCEQYDWKSAMTIWMDLLDANDVLKRSSAEYNMSVACYMLGDYDLALEWLDRSDKENKLPLSDALRKRIQSRIK